MAIKGALWKRIWGKGESIAVSLEKNALRSISLKSEKCENCGFLHKKYVPEYARASFEGNLGISEGNLVFYAVKEFTISIAMDKIELESLEKSLIRSFGTGSSIDYESLPQLLESAAIRDRKVSLEIPYVSEEGLKTASFVLATPESAGKAGHWLRELFRKRYSGETENKTERSQRSPLAPSY